jgi:hypothetical protein
LTNQGSTISTIYFWLLIKICAKGSRENGRKYHRGKKFNLYYIFAVASENLPRTGKVLPTATGNFPKAFIQDQSSSWPVP